MGWFNVPLLSWAPWWVVSLVEFGVAVAAALLGHALLYDFLKRVVEGRSLFWRSLVKRSEGLTRVMLLAVALGLVAEIAPLDATGTRLVQRLLLLAIIAIVAWILMLALRIWIVVYLRRFETGSTDPFLARKHVTQTHILQRVAGFAIWLTAIGVMLMTFAEVREYGVSILASAGAAGIILGLALQPVLQNLIAGIQIAVTQPVRIGDSLIVEGEYGTVEDIKATYVVIRLWDLRRMVIPLSYFLEKPFQNWTRESSDLMGAFTIYLDYTVPVAALRARAKEAVEAHAKWDRKVFAVQVTDFRENVMEVRVLVSASDSGKLFDLRADLRETLIGFLQREYPNALPHQRVVISEGQLSTGRPANGTGAAAGGWSGTNP